MWIEVGFRTTGIALLSDGDQKILGSWHICIYSCFFLSDLKFNRS